MPAFYHDSVLFRYEERGSGHPFVFQHGLGGDVTQPLGIFTPAEGTRLISMDTRGHGATEPLGDPDRLCFRVFAEDLGELLDRLGIERAVLGGISMGAALALHFALRWPRRVRALVLSRPAWLDVPSKWNIRMFSMISELIRKQGAVRGLAAFEQTPGFRRIQAKWPDTARSFQLQFTKPGAAETACKLDRIVRDNPHPDRTAWARLDVPVLVLGNGQDPVHPIDLARELARSIPGAEFTEITSKSVSVAAHNQDVQKAIAGFLDRLG